MTSRATVLIVDDEPGMRDMLSYELLQEGFDVEVADSGLSAIAAMKRRKFDLAVTDFKMPGMDGAQTVEALQQIDPNIEVIVGTGYATIETAVDCMKRGAYDFIQKPYNVHELVLMLERAMQKSHLQGVVALYEASRALVGLLKKTDLISLVLGLAQRVLFADGCGLVLGRYDDLGAEISALSNLSEPPAGLLRILASRVSDDGLGVRLQVVSLAPSSDACRNSPFNSALVYPLSVRRQAIGALIVLRGKDRPEFSHSELQRGSVFANQLAMSLDNAQVHADLEQRIDELLTTREQLVRSEKLAIAGELAAAVAHEINNPLAFIQSNLSCIKNYSTDVGALWLAAKSAAAYLRNLPDPHAHEFGQGLLGKGMERTEQTVREIAECIDDSLEGVRRLADLVTGFTSLANVQEHVAAERIDLCEILAQSVSLLGSASNGRRKVQCEMQPGAVAMASRADVVAALGNIFGFLNSQGRHPENQQPIIVHLSRSSGLSRIAISDPTIVLSPEERLKLFDPRIAVDTRHGRTMRLNIAMALAHQLLSRNGAKLEVAADEHGGLCISIVLHEVDE